MSGILFDKIVFGPIHSRRFGQSLGVNLLPTNKKHCSFNCIYCECGWTKENDVFNLNFVASDLIAEALELKLVELNNHEENLDVITFAGNGEPTLHPEFDIIIDNTIRLRDKYLKNVKIVVLTNSTQLCNKKVLDSLKKIELPVLKIDSGNEETFNKINLPTSGVKFNEIISNITQIDAPIIQTIFLRGEVNGVYVDNTTDQEIYSYIEVLKKVAPSLVMIYPIDRTPPAKNLEKLTKEDMKKIANRIESAGYKVFSV
ncbi:MAG: hypothetical protein A2X12_11345 [Bacteroidetes bacterium GWE2_29_8]|nr:MAG: hypothetical protein A2X12_11345 [Bacteroidetes bacterium GWE2_29_8]OFY23068.1 MAG: hypothetical protein A2X02_09570 [Bacteroidetes bacterium GWF2_29_10]